MNYQNSSKHHLGPVMKRLFPILIIVAVLLGLIVYSQVRSTPQHVSGFVEADEVRLGSRVGGRIQSVFVQEGQEVTKGQLLVELEPYDLLQREQEAARTLAGLEADFERLNSGFRIEEVGQARSRYEQAKARYDLLVAGPRPQEIEAANGRLQMAESELTLAKQNFDRSKDLVERQATSQAEFDASSEQFRAAQAQVVVRRQELSLLELGTREEEKREAKARVDEAEQAWRMTEAGYRKEEIARAKSLRDAAQSALESIREQKKELRIVSPVDGIIETLDLQKGDLIPPNAPVLSIIDQTHLWVRAYVPQNRVGLQVGDQLLVTLVGLPGEKLDGRVTFISRQAEFTPSNVQTLEERSKQVFRIKVALDDPSVRIHPGMTADVWLPAWEGES